VEVTAPHTSTYMPTEALVNGAEVAQVRTCWLLVLLIAPSVTIRPLRSAP